MDPRDFRSIFRQMFGFPNHGGQSREDIYQERDELDPRQERRFPDDGRSTETDGFNFHSRGFSVYTDPLEMNRFFDQQLDEMLRMFGHSFGFGSGHGEAHSYGGFGPGANRMIPMEPVEPDSDIQAHARDFMLKDDGQQPRVDIEVDSDSVDMKELDQLMKSRDNPCDFHHHPRQNNLWDLFPRPSLERRDEGERLHSFGGGSISVTQRTVTGNGCQETTRTVKNGDGSEVVTVTKQVGDKSYETVTSRTRDGAVSTEERLVNITENELDQFKLDLKDNKQELRSQPRDDMIRSPKHDQLFPSLWKKFFDE